MSQNRLRFRLRRGEEPANPTLDLRVLPRALYAGRELVGGPWSCHDVAPERLLRQVAESRRGHAPRGLGVNAERLGQDGRDVDQLLDASVEKPGFHELEVDVR